MSTSKRACTGTTRKGKPCKAAPLKGRDVCLAHADKETRASAGFGGVQGGGGRPRQPRVTDVYADELHRRVGEHIDQLLGRLIGIALDAERIVVVGTGPNARVEIAPDQALQLAALRELNDRILGRPKQSTEISGPEGAPIQLEAPADHADRATRAARLLHDAGLLQQQPALNGSNGNGHAANGNGNGHH